VVADNPTNVLPLGDNAYQNGSLAEYNANYEPTWGRFKAKSWPVPGNHDYQTSNAAGYFSYFGAQAPAAYYSWDLGDWHMIALNSEIAHTATSPQVVWLQNDLSTTTKHCILAYFHKARFSSGTNHGNDSSQGPFWNALYTAGADVVLSAHEHHYERFAKQDPNGVAAANGITEFVVGTGGSSSYPFGTPVANSQVRINGTNNYGVLKLTLHSASYDWDFQGIAGATNNDQGTQACN
jgi:hypothetical protein